MGYSREIYDAAMAELESRRTRAGAEAAARRETLLRRRPRLREIEQEMAHSALRVTRAVLDGGDVTAAVPILRQNMTVDGELFHGAKVQVLQETDRGGVLSMVICEGKNRQIRRMCAYAGLTVLRLKRVREGAVRLGKLPAGQWRYLSGEEISALQGK